MSLLALTFLLAAGGCRTASHHARSTPADVLTAVYNGAPRELAKTTLPTYRIEPPDILLIEVVRAVPRSPYYLAPMDTLAVHVDGALSDAPISGIYPIQVGGLLHLGYQYGAVRVAGLTVQQARQALEQHLKNFLRQPFVTLSLDQIGPQQQIAGEHLVGPDGMVTLGCYGSVPLVGMTLAEAKWALEQHLSQFFENPQVAVDVFAYNSKVYYVITEGAGLGDGVYRFPITGNETVLDAIAQINGLEQVSSKKIWIARPTLQPGHTQILPVQWHAVTANGCAQTNYQVLPGDRVFIAEDRWVAMDTAVAKLTAPFERLMGFSLLGVGTVTRFSGPVLRGGGNRGSTF